MGIKVKKQEEKMRITLLYDNDVYKKGLQADWGFSCLVEIENTPTILFDTGTNGSILLSNMEKLNIDPASIDEVFISHAHFDHVGGLSAFLNVKSDVIIYVPPSLRGVRGGKEVISVSEPLTIHENVFSTGELDHIEQSMAVKTEKGIVIIAGCSHPRMAHILKAASQFGKVYAIIGGLHGFSEYALFKDLELICPTHCTQHKAEIKSLFPEQYIDGGVGRVIIL
jgi:7,8-dihydropterin-6-yl-methyl-4-(beta-D-ribofuranosyl)aminobenzene 5'-phosphate synthase